MYKYKFTDLTGERHITLTRDKKLSAVEVKQYKKLLGVDATYTVEPLDNPSSIDVDQYASKAQMMGRISELEARVEELARDLRMMVDLARMVDGWDSFPCDAIDQSTETLNLQPAQSLDRLKIHALTEFSSYCEGVDEYMDNVFEVYINRLEAENDN